MKIEPPIRRCLKICALFAVGFIFSGCAGDPDSAAAQERAAATAAARRPEYDPLSTDPSVGGLFPHDRE